MSNASLELGGDNWAAKDGNLLGYAVGDSSGKYVPREFTFTRGSNLAATRVAANGLIEKGRENLLVQSNNFDTTWTETNSIVTPNATTAPDGTNTASKIVENTASTTQHRINQVTTSSAGVKTFSVYLKQADAARTTAWIRIGLSGCAIDLSDGSTSEESANILSFSTPIANGWYRVSITKTDASANETVRINIGQNDYSGDGTSGIFVWRAQYEEGLVATDYIETGATTVQAGLLEDEPRIDYTGGTGSLLLEPNRTNLIPQSEYLGSWFSSAGTLTANIATSPEGVKNAYSYSNNEYGIFKQIVTLSTSTQYTFSFYAKNVDATDAKYRVYDDTNATDIISSTSYFSQLSTNEWKRIEVTFTTSATGTTYGVYLASGNQSGKALFYGAQLEEGSYSSSYIPNHSGGSVTRGADVNTLLNQSEVIGQTEGTILFDAYFDEADKVNFSISDSTSSNYILIDTTSGKQVFARVQQGGSTQATISTSGSFFTEGDRLKCAIAYDSQDMAFYINGTQVGTAAPNLIPTCDDVRFSRWNGALSADQRVNQVVLFDTRISNNNLATLTT